MSFKLPHFVVIGAMKAGTTSLHEILSRHSEICMSTIKEPNFFTSNHKQGLSWYSSLFKRDCTLYGEASPSYTRRHLWPGCAELMYQLVPNSKLIYIVRDPIERLISHLYHDMYRDRITFKVNELLDEHSDYVLTSKYFYQISQYLEYFPASSVLILPFEQLRDNPQTLLLKLYNFINISGFEPIDQTQFYATDNRYLIKKFDLAKKCLPDSFRKIYHYLFFLLNIKIDKPILDSNTLYYLKEILKNDIANFKKLSNYEFPEWKVYNEI